ncbi:MAG: hypothetical protein NC218_03250 [Acetobacter sp.]|nr:hypothetical protein [Acetobacter sp.]
MKRDEMLKVFKQLAQSQGMWGRLLREIDEMDEEVRENMWAQLEAKNFKDRLDLIMFIENGE